MQRALQISPQNAHCRYAKHQLPIYLPKYNQMSGSFTTPIAAPANAMTLTCPEKAMETIPIQKPVHILKLPMACSATSPNFYLPPRYETLNLDEKYIPKYGKSSHDKYFSTGFLHMEISWKQQK